MTHIRYTTGLAPGGAKQTAGINAKVEVVLDDESTVDISRLVMEAVTSGKVGEPAVLTLSIVGWELA